MNPSNFMLGMGAAIAADDELQAWCVEVLGKALTVFVGADLENPPEVSAYPLCALLDCVEKRGEGQRNHVFALDVSVAVYDEEIKEEENLRIYSGLPKAAELKHRVEGAILRSGLAASVDFPDSDGLLPLVPIFLGFSLAECEVLTTSRNALRR